MTLAVILVVGFVLLGFVIRLVEGVIKFALILVLVALIGISAVFTHSVPTAAVTGGDSR